MREFVNRFEKLYQSLVKILNRLLHYTTPQALLEMAWQQFLQRQPPLTSVPFKLRQATFKGDGLHENLVNRDWSTIRELAYQNGER